MWLSPAKLRVMRPTEAGGGGGVGTSGARRRGDCDDDCVNGRDCEDDRDASLELRRASCCSRIAGDR